VAPKTDALLIRLTPEDRVRLQRVAESNYLEASTWARQILMRAVAEAETSHPPRPNPTRRRPAKQ
jgi:hypothetical protein